MVALDEGQIRVGRRFASISELELELKHGKAGDVFKLAREFTNLVSAKLALKSKSERGYDLSENKPNQAACAEKIKLRRGMSTANAFRVIARSALRHITANETPVQSLDPEGVHQIRVGLRRLRAAISLFSKLFGDKQTEQIPNRSGERTCHNRKYHQMCQREVRRRPVTQRFSERGKNCDGE